MTPRTGRAPPKMRWSLLRRHPLTQASERTPATAEMRRTCWRRPKRRSRRKRCCLTTSPTKSHCRRSSNRTNRGETGSPGTTSSAQSWWCSADGAQNRQACTRWRWPAGAVGWRAVQTPAVTPCVESMSVATPRVGCDHELAGDRAGCSCRHPHHLPHQTAATHSCGVCFSASFWTSSCACFFGCQPDYGLYAAWCALTGSFQPCG